MAELTMANATYGRDTAGAKKVLTEVNSRVTAACNALKGKEYNNVISMVKANWSGVDAESFIKEFDRRVTGIDGAFKKMSNTLVTEMSELEKSFVQSQNQNADMFRIQRN